MNGRESVITPIVGQGVPAALPLSPSALPSASMSVSILPMHGPDSAARIRIPSTGRTSQNILANQSWAPFRPYANAKEGIHEIESVSVGLASGDLSRHRALHSRFLRR
jgi:hypothetical protein